MSSVRAHAPRVLAAFALANARYWLCVARQVHAQMRHWEARAQAIEDPELRALALEKLRSEGFNAEAAAMAATIAPRATREHAVRAIVALELLYDYLDGLGERPHADPLGEGERLYAAFLGALDPSVEILGADAYLHELGAAVRDALALLPASPAIGQVALRCAARGAQAQIRMHATPLLGAEQLGEWARGEQHGTTLQWREFAAGAACSVLALHALIAAAADPRTTPEHAEAIERAYLFTGAVVTLLDGVVDRERDLAAGAHSYAGLYEDETLLAQALAAATREASRHTRELQNGAHHLMTLAAAAAYWCSAPGADAAHARPALEELRRELRGLLFIPLLAMRTWRVSRAARPRRRALATEVQL
jgi:tetraprenyl-beta-curcumene synthase